MKNTVRGTLTSILASATLAVVVMPFTAHAFDLNPFARASASQNAGREAASVGASSIEVGFSPRGHAMDLAVKVINSAHTSLDIAAYEFTSRRIDNAVRAAIARGVRVRIAVDAKENVGRRNSIAYDVAAAGAQVRYIDAYPIMHDKIVIIDRSSVETGSLNFTAAADLRNRENALVIWNNLQLAAVYERDFEDLWSLGHPLQ